MNDKPKIRIADTQFSHGTSLGSGDLKIFPQYFDWYRGNENINDVIVITESMFHKVDQFTEKVKIAWLLEPTTINMESYKWIGVNFNKFDYILSHNHVFLNLLSGIMRVDKTPLQLAALPKIEWYPFGGCWIMPEDRKIYHKTKLISIIASDKKETEGHRFRHEVIAALGGKIDVYGRGYKPVEFKLEALKDYRYSIVIENESTPGFFTEKVIDCFMTGTIPIYSGDPELNKLLNKTESSGPYFQCAETFTTIADLKSIVDQIIDTKLYAQPLLDMFLEFNFNSAKAFTCPEDWLWLNFFTKHNLISE